MAKQTVPIWALLLLFIFGLAAAVTTALYLDLRHKFAGLEAQNRELAASQVLLMVPDDQAQALAQWLESHPNETERLLKRVENKANNAIDDYQRDEASSPKQQDAQGDIPEALVPEVISENADGVKVIVLPHGGIRVTTREEKN